MVVNYQNHIVCVTRSISIGGAKRKDFDISTKERTKYTTFCLAKSQNIAA